MAEPARMQKKPRVGYRFHPTEEELVAHFLRHKLKADDPSIHDDIAEIDVCKFEPWDLPAFSPIESDDSEWFFFSPRDYKYSNSTRFNRKTPRGFWKPTGKDRKIKIRGTDRTIGTKKTLVFHERRGSRVVRTDWVIHEYHDATLPPDQGTYVLCRLIKKPQKITENPEEHCMPSMNQMPLGSNEFLNSMESDGFVNPMIQPPLISGIQTTHESDSFLDSSIRTPHESDSFLDSSIQTLHELDNFLDSSIQTPYDSNECSNSPYDSNECSNSLVQTPHESGKFVNLSIHPPHKSDEVVDSLLQASPGSYKIFDSMMESPHQSCVFWDSSMETLLKSFEFEVNPLLELSASVYEQELLGNDNI